MTRTSPELVSVVIPVLNGASVLPIQLAALENQTYEGTWELLVVDNGSTDETVQVARSWSDRLPMRIIDASDAPGISHARNRGLAASLGDLIAFCDSDDEASAQWLDAMVDAARRYDFVEGQLEFESLNEELAESGQSLPFRRPLQLFGEFLPFATGANFCVWKDVAADLGGWTTDYEYGGDDVEFSFRLQLAGYHLGHCPDAVMRYRLRGDLRSIARQQYRYGLCHVQIYKDFKEYGMVRSDALTAIKSWIWIVLHIPWVVSRTDRRRKWVEVFSRRAGRLVGSIRFRTAYL